MLLHPLQQVDTVGVIVAGNKFKIITLLRVQQCRLEQPVHGITGHLQLHIAVAVTVTTTGIIQMRQVKLVYALILHQLQHVGKLNGVILGHGKAQTNFYIALTAQTDTGH